MKANVFFSCLKYCNTNQSGKLVIFMFVPGCFCWEENLVTKTGAFDTPYPKNLKMYDSIDLKATNSCLKTYRYPGRILSWLSHSFMFLVPLWRHSHCGASLAPFNCFGSAGKCNSALCSRSVLVLPINCCILL